MGRIESAGNTATLDASLRYTIASASSITDVELSAITQISKTADYKIDDECGSCEEIVTHERSYFILLTGTTAAITEIEIQGIELNIDKK